MSDTAKYHPTKWASTKEMLQEMNFCLMRKAVCETAIHGNSWCAACGGVLLYLVLTFVNGSLVSIFKAHHKSLSNLVWSSWYGAGRGSTVLWFSTVHLCFLSLWVTGLCQWEGHGTAEHTSGWIWGFFHHNLSCYLFSLRGLCGMSCNLNHVQR